MYVDVGLTVGHLGARADAVLAEFFELAPFGKLLFSTDAYRLPELYLVGAAQFRHSLGRLLDGWVAEGAMSAEDAGEGGPDGVRRERPALVVGSAADLPPTGHQPAEEVGHQVSAGVLVAADLGSGRAWVMRTRRPR